MNRISKPAESVSALLAAGSVAKAAAQTPGHQLLATVAVEMGRRARRRLASRRTSDPDSGFRQRYEERMRYKGLL